MCYELLEAGTVNLGVYDLLGREVAKLEEEYRKPGQYRVTWDGTDSDGNPVSTGVYLYRMRMGEKEEAKRMMLVR